MIAGQKLRQYRERRGVRPVDVAAQMDEPRQRIGQIEQAQSVTVDVAERFVTAVLKAAGETVERVKIAAVLYVDGMIEPW